MNDGAERAVAQYMDKIVNEARQAERIKIAEQVRRNCTLDWDVMQEGGDGVIYAVADWIEHPPEWVQ